METERVRGATVDFIVGRDRYLIKAVSRLRLTYQIRLLTLAAVADGAHLLIRLPKSSEVSPDLRRHIEQNKKYVRIQRT